jgi:predicted lysophospholipase L1 biosynthesis ABC-type transport system permease subunit
VVRTNGDPSALAGSVREALRSVDKGIATYNLKTMNDVVSISAAPRRLPMLLLSAFAAVAMLLAVVGIVLGVAGAALVTRYLSSLLFGVQPIDAITIAAVGLGLVLVALVASLIPARRATRVDPLTALRYE